MDYLASLLPWNDNEVVIDQTDPDGGIIKNLLTYQDYDPQKKVMVKRNYKIPYISDWLASDDTAHPDGYVQVQKQNSGKIQIDPSNTTQFEKYKKQTVYPNSQAIKQPQKYTLNRQTKNNKDQIIHKINKQNLTDVIKDFKYSLPKQQLFQALQKVNNDSNITDEDVGSILGTFKDKYSRERLQRRFNTQKQLDTLNYAQALQQQSWNYKQKQNVAHDQKGNLYVKAEHIKKFNQLKNPNKSLDQYLKQQIGYSQQQYESEKATWDKWIKAKNYIHNQIHPTLGKVAQFGEDMFLATKRGGQRVLDSALDLKSGYVETMVGLSDMAEGDVLGGGTKVGGGAKLMLSSAVQLAASTAQFGAGAGGLYFLGSTVGKGLGMVRKSGLYKRLTDPNPKKKFLNWALDWIQQEGTKYFDESLATDKERTAKLIEIIKTSASIGIDITKQLIKNKIPLAAQTLSYIKQLSTKISDKDLRKNIKPADEINRILNLKVTSQANKRLRQVQKMQAERKLFQQEQKHQRLKLQSQIQRQNMLMEIEALKYKRQAQIEKKKIQNQKTILEQQRQLRKLKQQLGQQRESSDLEDKLKVYADRNTKLAEQKILAQTERLAQIQSERNRAVLENPAAIEEGALQLEEVQQIVLPNGKRMRNPLVATNGRRR